MGFISNLFKQEKEHGLAYVLFNVQVAWMATLGISKKEYFIKMALMFAITPLLIFLGYGEFAEKFKNAGLKNYENIITNFFAANILFIHYIGKVFPYLVILNIIVLFLTKMWSKQFWVKVEEIKLQKSQE